MTDYPRCKTCKHYKNDEYRICSAPLVSYGYRDPPKDIQKAVLDRGLYVEDDEGWGMMPGPNFGCILHEERN